MILLNKLLEDGNTLFRNCRYDAAAYRYEYALKRIPRLKPIDDNDENKNPETNVNNKLRQKNAEKDDVFSQLRIHLLLNLSRTKRKQTVIRHNKQNAFHLSYSDISIHFQIIEVRK